MFKISVLIGVFMLVLSVSLQGLWIDHTKTISASQLTDIRSASTNLGIDALTYKLWEKYQTTVRMDSTDVRDSERSYSDTFGFQSMALSIFIRSIHDNPDGAVGVDVETAQYVLNYLNTFNWDDFKLAIQGITPITSHPEWEGLNDYTRGRELCYSLMFYALIVDLLYNGSTTVAEQDQMDSILEDLADLQTWAYDTFINHDPTAWQTLGWEDNYNQTQPVGFCIDYGPTEPKMPQIGFAVNRVHLLSLLAMPPCC